MFHYVAELLQVPNQAEAQKQCSTDRESSWKTSVSTVSTDPTEESSWFNSYIRSISKLNETPWSLDFIKSLRPSEPVLMFWHFLCVQATLMLSLSATCLPQLRRPPLLPCLVERVLLAQTRFRLHRLELQLVALELPSSQSRSGPFAIIQPRRWPHADLSCSSACCWPRWGQLRERGSSPAMGSSSMKVPRYRKFAMPKYANLAARQERRIWNQKECAFGEMTSPFHKGLKMLSMYNVCCSHCRTMQLHPERQTHKTIILGSHTGPGFTVVYLMSSKSTWAFTHTHKTGNVL